MPSVGASTVPPTAILALLRKPDSAPATVGSHTGESTSERACASLSESCRTRGTSSRVQERQRKAS